MTRAILVTASDAPLVLVACREIDPKFGHDPVHCDACDNEGHVLVDEVFASDEILDHESWLAHSAWWDEEVAKQKQGRAA